MITLKSKRELDLMREAGKKLRLIFDEIKKIVKPGITTHEIDEVVERLILAHDAKPAFKGYRGYPASVCTSVNESVVHEIPSRKRKLKSGDVLSVDLGLIHKGYYSDAARTWPIGSVNDEARELVEVTQKALYLGIEQMKPGKRIGDISSAVQNYVEANGFSVVRDFVGHGIGRSLHEDPQVPNFGKAGVGPKLEIGMVLALEPMVTAGSWEVEILEDDWTVVTRDRQLAAHYEDTIALTEKGPENLTGPEQYIESLGG